MLGFIIVGILIVFIFLIYPGKKEFLKHHRFAHRGLYQQDQSILENSLEAFQKAIDHKQGIELDVQLTSDKVLVVFHDDTFNRIYHVDGLVCEKTFEECHQLGICRFDDVLELVNGQVPLIVELKHGRHNKELVTKAVERLKAYSGEFCVESFNPMIIYEVRKQAPHFIVGQLIMSYRQYEHHGIGLFINSLIYNFLTRPDFIAVEVHLYQKNPLINLYALLGGTQVIWTVHQEHFERVKDQVIIYEFFDPNN